MKEREALRHVKLGAFPFLNHIQIISEIWTRYKHKKLLITSFKIAGMPYCTQLRSGVSLLTELFELLYWY